MEEIDKIINREDPNPVYGTSCDMNQLVFINYEDVFEW